MEVQVLEKHTLFKESQKSDLRQVSKWDIGETVQTVALQLVMADLLSGDTTHHASNVPFGGKHM